MKPRESLDDDTKKALRKALTVIDQFSALDPTMPIQYMRAFLLVAIEEGLGVSEYSAKAGVSPSVASRHIMGIGDRDRHMEPGLGLVTARADPMELRKHQVTLTRRGQVLAHQVARAIAVKH